ncbi:hypothetical protein ACTXT7_008406 [Hymenolepis weldensis]
MVQRVHHAARHRRPGYHRGHDFRTLWHMAIGRRYYSYGLKLAKRGIAKRLASDRLQCAACLLFDELGAYASPKWIELV